MNFATAPATDAERALIERCRHDDADAMTALLIGRAVSPLTRRDIERLSSWEAFYALVRQCIGVMRDGPLIERLNARERRPVTLNRRARRRAG